MTKINIAPNVTRKIEEYAKTLSQYTGYTQTGLNFKEKCKKAIKQLEIFPESFRLYDKDAQQRELIVGKYLILYKYDRNTDTVRVVNMKAGAERDYVQETNIQQAKTFSEETPAVPVSEYGGLYSTLLHAEQQGGIKEEKEDIKTSNKSIGRNME